MRHPLLMIAGLLLWAAPLAASENSGGRAPKIDIPKVTVPSVSPVPGGAETGEPGVYRRLREKDRNIRISPAEIEGRPRVVDGDTLAFGEANICLSGIDAPESGQSCFAERQSFPCGHMATAWLAERVIGRDVVCRGNRRDKDGCLLATCYVAETNLNAGAVRAGWALAVKEGEEKYRRDEETARKLEVGVWQGTFAPPWEWRREHGNATAVGDMAKPGERTENCLIKGDITLIGRRIYHLPGAADYKRVRIDVGKGERWFCSEDAALAAGWTKARR